MSSAAALGLACTAARRVCREGGRDALNRSFLPVLAARSARGLTRAPCCAGGLPAASARRQPDRSASRPRRPLSAACACMREHACSSDNNIVINDRACLHLDPLQCIHTVLYVVVRPVSSVVMLSLRLSRITGSHIPPTETCGSVVCWRAGGPAVFTAGYPYHPPSLDGMDMVFSACGAGAYDSSIELTACARSASGPARSCWLRQHGSPDAHSLTGTAGMS